MRQQYGYKNLMLMIVIVLFTFITTFYDQTIFVHSYPVIIHIDERAQRCFRFNIPLDDDAHFVALVLPDEEAFGDDDDEIETWYFDQIYEMTQTKQKHNIIPKQFVSMDTMPDIVAKQMSSYIQNVVHGDTSPVQILITATPSSDPSNFQHHIPTKFFHPIVLNYVGRTTDAKANHHRADKNEGNLEGYGICISNSDRSREVRVIFDIALISDKPYDNDEEDGKSKFNKEAHLTPLEISLDESIRAATVVLREMNYMEKREARMRETAESINVRVRWFSYLSVSILLSVTYIQVSYLKRYFHKKKLM